MADPLKDPTPLDEGADDGLEMVDFGDPELYLHMGISEARWERAKANPDVRDLIQDLFGLRGNPISCPFHGTDSKPSFNFFPKNNDCTCYGCGDGDNYWDNVKIVARNFGYHTPEGKDDRHAALEWLEAHYPMPKLKDDDSYQAPDMIIVEEEATGIPDDPLAKLDIKLLREHLVRLAAGRVRAQCNDPDTAVAIAQEHLELLFTALRDGNKLALARVLGRTETMKLIHSC